MDNRIIIDQFAIPDNVAKELSNLLIKQKIRKELLMSCVNDKEKYEAAEEMLIPIEAKIEAFKIKINNEYVPEKYRDEKYIWIYDGYEVSKNKVIISENKA